MIQLAAVGYKASGSYSGAVQRVRLPHLCKAPPPVGTFRDMELLEF